MTLYDNNFYDTINEGSRLSASVIVPVVLPLLNTDRPMVVDVGCGEGVWSRAFSDAGADVTGIDGAYIDATRLCIPENRFVRHDLNQPIPNLFDHGRPNNYDLAVSLEVAEHLVPERAAGFVRDLCNLAPVVLFSAAIPGQGGVGHVNEQWPQYWEDHFWDNGFTMSGALRWEFWNDGRVENWYRQNLMLCVKKTSAAFLTVQSIMDGPLAAPWPVVHPVLHDHLRSLR